MIEINNKIFRNLQEQVFKNMQDIADIKMAEKVLADFGIKVLGNYPDLDALYDAHPEETYPGDFGDCYTIGTEPPYDFYVFTRTSDTSKRGEWFFIGTFPQPGPQGPQGIQGIQGVQGPAGTALLSGNGAPSGSGIEGQLYLNLQTSSIYKFSGGVWVITANIKGNAGEPGPQGLQGPKGDTGDTGPQGPQGDVGGFINIQGHVNSTANLPNPSTITDRTWAFLVGDSNDLYVQVPTTPGGSTYLWQNFGELNVGTYVTVNGTYVNTYEMDNKLDKVTTEDQTAVGRLYAIKNNGVNYIIRFIGGNGASEIGTHITTNYIPCYSEGSLVTRTPIRNYQAANKIYVDSSLPKIWRG